MDDNGKYFFPVKQTYSNDQPDRVAENFDSLFMPFLQGVMGGGDVSGRIMALQEALGKVQQETANEINRLQHELEEKNKILEDLQKQLEEQQDYEDIKKHCQ